MLTQQLREFGFGSVKSVSRIVDARQMLEQRSFDVVICDHHFDQSGERGKTCCELRRERMLPYSRCS